MSLLNVSHHVVYVSVPGLYVELLVNELMHVGYSQFAFHVQLKLFLDVLVVYDMFVPYLDLVVVMHLYGTRPKISHSVLSPFEFTHYRTISQTSCFDLDALGYLLFTAGSFVTPNRKLGDKSILEPSAVASLELYLES